MVIVVLCSILFLEQGATKGILRDSLNRKISGVWRDISIKNDKLYLKEDNKKKYENLTYVILDNNEQILLGEFPKNVTIEDISLEDRRMQYLRTSNAEYVYRTSGKHSHKDDSSSQDGIIVVGFMKANSVSNIYRRISYLVSGAVLLTAVLIISLLLFVSKKLAGELKNVTKRAGQIGVDNDFLIE